MLGHKTELEVTKFISIHKPLNISLKTRLAVFKTIF